MLVNLLAPLEEIYFFIKEQRENEMHYNRGLMDNNGRKNSIKLIGLPPKVFIKSDTIPTTLVYFRPSSSSAFL